MALLIFFIVLSILVIVHEAGHFIAAKRAGVRVDEFGLGFPPRMTRLFRAWDTDFTLNWIPFGGFVKIFGENYDKAGPHVGHGASPMSDMGQQKHFTQVSKIWQVVILAAGVSFNFLLAWAIFCISFMIGVPYSVENELGSRVTQPALTIVMVLPESPAFEAGLKTGDIIREISSATEVITASDPQTVSDFIARSDSELTLSIDRGGEVIAVEATPSEQVVSGRFALGISMDMVGILRLPVHEALVEGTKTSFVILSETAKGLGNLVVDSVRGKADLSQVTGPVGIVGIVGDASELGFVYILTLTAFISINLAIINLVPIPSLDGGRILFVIIEAIRRKPVSERVFNIVNSVSFSLLILLMILITIRDVANLF